MLQDEQNSTILFNEGLNSLGRILSNSPTSREAFRCQKGFEVLICFLQKLKGSLSPDASYGRTGLPKVELAHKIDAVFNLLSGKSQIFYLFFPKNVGVLFFLLFQAATRGCALSSEQFSQVIPPTALFAAIRSFGCFYEYGKMDRLADSKVNVKFSLKQLDSNEKILQMDELSISIRRVLLAISPLWRVVRG